MKKFGILALAFAIGLSVQAADSRTIESHPFKAKVARIVEVVKLVDKNDLKVNIVVEDSGSSTDVSPTEVIYLTIFREGEMFDVDAAFEVGTVIDFKSAKRVSGGVYDVTFTEYTDSGLVTVTRRLDAITAINAAKAVSCGGEFDCAEAVNFKSTMTSTVVSKKPQY